MKPNKQDSDYKMMKPTEYFKSMLTAITDHINNLEYSPNQKDSRKTPDPTTVVPDNRRAPTLDGGQSMEIGGMWTLKHEIRSSKFYEILIKTELKIENALDLKIFHNHTNMCLNKANRLRKDLLFGYQSIKRHYESAEYFSLDRDNP